MILSLLAAWLIERYGWRAAYRDLGVLVIVASLPLAALFAGAAAGADAFPERRNTGSSREPVASRIPFLFLVTAIFLYAVSFNAIVSHLAPLLTDRGWLLHRAAEALSILGFCGFAGRLLTGAGAAITLTDISSGIKLGTTSDAKGEYIFSPLAPGRYQINIAAGGSAIRRRGPTFLSTNLPPSTLLWGFTESLRRWM